MRVSEKPCWPLFVAGFAGKLVEGSLLIQLSARDSEGYRKSIANEGD